MKKITLFLLTAVVGVSTMFIGCKDDNGPGGTTFTASTKEITNDVPTLGLVGTSVSSSNTNAATVVIDSGKVKITSVNEGTSTIMVSDGTNNATISVVVSASGAITETIGKYQVVANVTANQTGNYVVLSTTTEGASITYTIDGGGWTAYTAGSHIIVKTGTAITAKATKSGWADSGVANLGSFTARYNRVHWVAWNDASNTDDFEIKDLPAFSPATETTFLAFKGSLTGVSSFDEPEVTATTDGTYTLSWVDE